MSRSLATRKRTGQRLRAFMGRQVRLLAITTAIVTVVLFSIGGLVRGTGSGDGCGDNWPNCTDASLFPPGGDINAIIEFSHRAVAGVVGILIGLLLVAVLCASDRRRRILVPAVLGVPLVLIQAWLGRTVVVTDLSPWWLTAHFAFGMGLVANQVYLATQVRVQQEETHGGGFARLATWMAGMTLSLLMVGTYVRASDAGLAFSDWPLMNGRLVPMLGGGATWMFAHRVLAALAFAMALWVMIRAWTMRPRVRAFTIWSTVVAALYVAQIFVGALNVFSKLAPVAVTLHVALSVLVWSATIVLALVARRTPVGVVGPDPKMLAAQRPDDAPADATETSPATTAPAKATALQQAHAYFMLTKPRIIVLLLITTVPAMILAAGTMPSFWLILATLVGGTLAAGAANAINCYLDRDIDQIMKRTRKRPLPAHQVSPESALRFGFVLGAISFYFMSMTVNVLSATLALSAIAFYVFVYTLWLKRSTDQNIVIGGAAGAVPVLVGWAAVTNTVGLPAILLFGVIFVWTPPHFWALAMRFQNDYAEAGVPMMPAVRGQEATLKQILAYSLALFGVTLILAPVAGMGLLYLAVAVVLGGMFVYKALMLQRHYSVGAAWKLFKFSITYLAAIFGAVALDTLL